MAGEDRSAANHAASRQIGGRFPRRRFLTGATALGGIALAAGASLPGCAAFGTAPAPTPTFQPAVGETGAERAVNAARQFRGATIRIGWESGLQAQDPILYSGPLWEQLTGIRVVVVETGLAKEQQERILREQASGFSTLDCASIAPTSLAELVAANAVRPLDDFIEHYMPPADREDYLPAYRDLGVIDGRTYGLFDDGDALLVYYRTDLFADPANQRDFAAAYGRPLGTPEAYDLAQFLDVARFITERFAPGLYGLAPFNRDLRWGWFQALLRVAGGQFFDPATMRAMVNAPAAVQTMAALARMDRFMPPDASDVDPPVLISTYLSGNAAMASYWPPLGRWAEGVGQVAPHQTAIPPTQVSGRTGYALLPGGYTELAVGFVLSVLSASQQPEPAYLFLQWLTSPEISLQRVMLPYALRDPYRLSHFRSQTYRERWPSAPAYLDTLMAGGERALLDLIIPGVFAYTDAFHVAVTNVRLGTSVQAAMDEMAASWDAITDSLGRDRQREAYHKYLQTPGATVSSLSQATRPRGLA